MKNNKPDKRADYNDVVVERVSIDTVACITKHGRQYNSFQHGKDGIMLESAKQECEYLL